MTLEVNENGVNNTHSTEVTIGGKISVGGNFTNTGKVNVFEGGHLLVSKELLNTGSISINDPEKIKQIIVETIKTTGSVAEFGSEFLKKLGITS